MTEPTPSEAAQPTPTQETQRVTVRRAPKYVPFLIAGAVLGVIAAAIIAVVPPDNQYDKSTVFGFFVVLTIIAGAGLGGLVALVVDWIGRRKAAAALVQEATEQSPTETE